MRMIRFTITRILVLGFLCLVLLGALLLSLPVSDAAGQGTPFLDALFTSTSATCVTGLVVRDTLTHWSLFGQIVIIVLIQIGGLGFMTVMTLFSMLMRRQIGLRERMLLVQSAGGMELAGIVRLIRRILLGTLLFEGSGAVLLSIRFVQDFGWGEGIYKAVFTSISAFCNAGFDLLGNYASLTGYAGDPLVLVPVMLLILTGGIGFLVWNDLFRYGFRFSKYSLHTKLVLSASAVLVAGGAVLFFCFEQNTVLSGKPFGEQVLDAFFLSVTPRTAGFAGVDYAALSEPGYLLTLLWMMIGGSAGSTAGGLKITTVLVLLFDAVAAVRQAPQITVFKRRIEEKMVRQAAAVALIYLLLVCTGSFLVCASQPLPLKDVLFEAVSAASTVGLSTGITLQLEPLGRCVMIVLMFGGRVGLLTLLLAWSQAKPRPPIDRPAEKILIG